MNLIALGRTATMLVKKLKEYDDDYIAWFINHSESTAKNHYTIKHQSHPEDYEANAPNLGDFFSDIGGQELIFVVNGAELISACSLRILEQVKKAKITILYIKPERSLLSAIEKKNENLCFKVFQNYARSGVFERMYLVNNENLESILGPLSIKNYEESIIGTIAHAFYSIQFLSQKETLMGELAPPDPACKLATFGVIDLAAGTEKMFYDLKMPREFHYLYGLPESSINDNSTFLAIREQLYQKSETKVFEQKEDAGELLSLIEGMDLIPKIKTNYVIVELEQQEPAAFFIAFTSAIQ